MRSVAICRAYLVSRDDSFGVVFAWPSVAVLCEGKGTEKFSKTIGGLEWAGGCGENVGSRLRSQLALRAPFCSQRVSGDQPALGSWFGSCSFGGRKEGKRNRVF